MPIFLGSWQGFPRRVARPSSSLTGWEDEEPRSNAFLSDPFQRHLLQTPARGSSSKMTRTFRLIRSLRWIVPEVNSTPCKMAWRAVAACRCIAVEVELAAEGRISTRPSICSAPVKAVALALTLFFVVVLAGAAFGLDLGCADDCGDGNGCVPCRTACASCLCNPVVPAGGEGAALVPLSCRSHLFAASDSAPLRGVARSVLHVPLSA